MIQDYSGARRGIKEGTVGPCPRSALRGGPDGRGSWRPMWRWAQRTVRCPRLSPFSSVDYHEYSKLCLQNFLPNAPRFSNCAFTSNHDARQMGCAVKSPPPRSVWFPPLAFAPVVAYFASEPLRGFKCKFSCMNFHLMLSSKVSKL